MFKQHFEENWEQICTLVVQINKNHMVKQGSVIVALGVCNANREF